MPYLDPHLPSTKTPVMLAFGYHTHMDPMGYGANDDLSSLLLTEHAEKTPRNFLVS